MNIRVKKRVAFLITISTIVCVLVCLGSVAAHSVSQVGVIDSSVMVRGRNTSSVCHGRKRN